MARPAGTWPARPGTHILEIRECRRESARRRYGPLVLEMPIRPSRLGDADTGLSSWRRRYGPLVLETPIRPSRLGDADTGLSSWRCRCGPLVLETPIRASRLGDARGDTSLGFRGDTRLACWREGDANEKPDRLAVGSGYAFGVLEIRNSRCYRGDTRSGSGPPMRQCPARIRHDRLAVQDHEKIRIGLP